MSWNLTEEVELIMFPNDDNWSSANSITTQKVQKLSKPDLAGSLPELISNVTIKEVEIQKCRSRIPEHWDEKDWEPADARFKFRISKSWTQHEVDILKINLSAQEKNIDLTESDGDKKKSKSFRELFRSCGRWNCMKTLAKKKIRDLMAEIEGSETAKKDTKAWKFLQRASALRKELVNSRRYLEVQDWFSLDFYIQNAEPLRVTCPNCTFFITTSTKKVATMRTKFFSIIFAILGLCIASFALYSFKDTVHLCPLCRIYLGFWPAIGFKNIKRNIRMEDQSDSEYQGIENSNSTMVSASSTSAKNLFVESKLRLSDRVQVNVNNIAAIARQIQRGSKANENLIAAAKNFALQEAAIENSETNLKKLRLLTTHLNSQVESVQNNSSKMEIVLEQVRSMQR